MPGLFSFAAGGLLSVFWLGRKVLPPHVRVHRNPLLPLSILFTGFGMQCIMVGLLAELLMRTYHESQGKSIYVVKEVLSSPEQPSLEEKDRTEAPFR